jgi:hypothetical protein
METAHRKPAGNELYKPHVATILIANSPQNSEKNMKLLRFNIVVI